MSDLDNAMLEHMAFIVFSEHRPFCYGDFTHFEIGGKEYGMKHGTYRNKIMALKKKGEVELDSRSGPAFYTLKGHKFGKQMTQNRIVVHSNPFYKMLQELPLDKQSIHDVRLKFKVSDIWEIFSINPKFPANTRFKSYWSSSNMA